MDKPQLYMIAGPNGAGKTTIAMRMLPLMNNVQILDNSVTSSALNENMIAEYKLGQLIVYKPDIWYLIEKYGEISDADD